MGGRWLKNMTAEEQAAVAEQRAEARRQRSRNHYHRDPDQSRAKGREKYANNTAEIRQRARDKYDPIEEKVRTLRKTHGISILSWLSRFYYQGERCRCCKTQTPEAGWRVDHDHVTGQIRGIVCNWCNRVLGLLGDNAEGVREASNMFLRYLETS